MTASSVGGAWATVRRGIALSPELRHDVPLAVVAALVATAGRVITPIVIQQILDRGLLGGDVNLRFVFAMLVLAGAVTLLTAAATGVMHLRATTMSESALSALRIRTFQHIHDLSMLHQASEQRGALVSRVTSDIDQISHFMQWAGLQIIVNVAQAMVAVVVMLAYSVPLTITVLVFVPVIALTVRAFQTRIEAAFMVVREAVSDMLATLAETVVGSAVIRGYGAEREVQTRLSTAIEHHRASAVRAGSLSSAFSGISAVLSAASVAAVLIVGTVLAARGGPTIGTVVAFLFLVQLFIEPIDIVGEAINEAQTAVAGWRRVLDVLDLEPDVADPGGGVELSPEPLEILFDRVDFRYPRAGETPRTATGTLALTGVDVRIAPNSKVAVVGETGAGKTTFAKLLVRLMDPSDGQVQIGGIDIRRVEFASLRARTVMVPQEGGLFRGTIADNVAMGRPGAKREELLRAFGRLGLDDWLGELTAGLDTPVGERGSALSVGERQLVTLARAAISDPEVLVLDEATSSVDAATEVRIREALQQLSAGRTVVTIAHRLSTAEAADRILVFDDARLVQDGSHADLVDGPGVYAGLYAAWQRGAIGV